MEYGLVYTILSLFCANSFVHPVLYTFRMTEFKALSLVCTVDPCYDFPSTICNIYYARSPQSILKGLLRGLRQMLSKEILTDHVPKIKEISLHFVHN